MPTSLLWTKSGEIVAQKANAWPRRPRIIPDIPAKDMTLHSKLDKVRIRPPEVLSLA